VSSNPKSAPGSRSAARLNAVQALYEMEMSGAGSDSVIQEFMSNRWANAPILDDPDEDDAFDDEGNYNPVEAQVVEMAEPDQAFFQELVNGISSDRADLDGLITPHLAKEWPMDRLESVLRAILRCGAYELNSVIETPARVVINEYVEVTKAFFDGKEPGLVNGLLDNLAHQVRTTEFKD